MKVIHENCEYILNLPFHMDNIEWFIYICCFRYCKTKNAKRESRAQSKLNRILMYIHVQYIFFFRNVCRFFDIYICVCRFGARLKIGFGLYSRVSLQWMRIKTCKYSLKLINIRDIHNISDHFWFSTHRWDISPFIFKYCLQQIQLK